MIDNNDNNSSPKDLLGHMQQSNKVVEEATNEEQINNNPLETNIETPVTNEAEATNAIEETIDKKGKVEQHFPIGKETSKDIESVAMPTDYSSVIRDALSNLPNVNMADNEAAREWIKTLNESLGNLPMHDMFRATLEDPDASFTQKPEYKGKVLTASVPRFDKVENSVLKGEKAVIRIMQTLGLGNLIQIPLWHSGMHFTIKPPTEAELIELNRQFIADKIQFGRYSYGLAFSNTMCYTTDRLVDFALNHLYNSTLKTDVLDPVELKKLISCQDIPILVWGVLCSIYSNGYKYKRACIANPETCNHVIEETINITKLLVTNTNSLTDYQLEHMSYRQPRSRSLDQVTKYKDELTNIHQSRVRIDDDRNIFITIKTPSIHDYVNSGHLWVSNIVNTVEKTIASDATENEKDLLITRYAQASRLRQYSHWIESIEIDTNISEDRETIDELLNVLSSDDDISNLIMKKVREYIDHSVIALIGIAEFDCPKCKGTNSNPVYPKFSRYIPIDVFPVFFSLATQRLTRLIER